MSAVQKSLLAAVAAVCLVGVASGASAGVITSYDLNLGNAAAGGLYTGVSNIPNVSLLSLLNGDSIVSQNLSGGSPTGQSFSEVGVIQVTSAISNGSNLTFAPGALNSPFPGFGGLGTASALFFQFNLSGTVDSNGFLHFNSGGTAGLYLTNSATVDVLNPVVPGTSQQLATFDLLGSGGSGLISAGGVPSGTIQLNFKEDPTSPFNQLFTVGGNPLDNIGIELANIQPSLSSQPGVPSPNPAVPAACVPSDPKLPPTCETIYVTDQGQLQLTVPEPGTLALIGSSLLGLGLVRRRRKG